MKKFFLFSVSIIILFSIFFPTNYIRAAGDSCVRGGGGSIQLCNPLGVTSDFKSFAYKAVASFTTFFAIIALLFVVVSGFRMILARGDSEAISVAKSALTWAILGFMLALFAFALVNATATFLGAKDLNPTDVTTGPQNIQNPIQDELFFNSSTNDGLLVRILKGMLGLVGVLSIGTIIYGGFQYITSQGNDEQVSSAKSTIQWSIIGLILSLLAYVIIRATISLFSH